MRYGQMTVAEEQRTLVDGPVVSVAVPEWVSIRNVSMDSPLGLVWRSKKQRHEWNLLDKGYIFRKIQSRKNRKHIAPSLPC